MHSGRIIYFDVQIKKYFLQIEMLGIFLLAMSYGPKNVT